MIKFKDKFINHNYYRLKTIKKLADDTEIAIDEIFRKVSKKQKGLFQVETVNTTHLKKYFWVHEDEVLFIECKKEFCTAELLEQQYKEKNGMWM